MASKKRTITQPTNVGRIDLVLVAGALNLLQPASVGAGHQRLSLEVTIYHF